MAALEKIAALPTDQLVSGVQCSAVVIAMDALSAWRSPLGELIGAGTCDFCGEHAPALRAFDHAPAAGLCYCRKCAPESETDRDWEGGAS